MEATVPAVLIASSIFDRNAFFQVVISNVKYFTILFVSRLIKVLALGLNFFFSGIGDIKLLIKGESDKQTS